MTVTAVLQVTCATSRWFEEEDLSPPALTDLDVGAELYLFAPLANINSRGNLWMCKVVHYYKYYYYRTAITTLLHVISLQITTLNSPTSRLGTPGRVGRVP